MKKIILIITFLFFKSAVLAKEIKKYNLNLEKSIAIAIENNLEIKEKKLEYEKSKYSVKESFSEALPKIRYNSRFVYNIELPKNVLPKRFLDPNAKEGEVVAVEFGTKYNLTNEVSISQPIFDFAAFVGIKTSSKYKELYEKQLEVKKEQIINQTHKGYYNLFSINEQNKLYKIVVESFDSIYNQTKKYYEQGLIEDVRLLEVELQKNKAVSTYENIKKLKTIAEKNLKNILNISETEKIEINDSLDNQTLIAEAEKMLTIKRLDVTKRRDFELLNIQVDLMEKKKQYSNSLYFPKLNAIGAYNFNDAGNTTDGLFSDWQKGYYIGLSLSANIFSGLKTRYVNKKSKIDLEQSKIKREKNKYNMKVNLENVINNLEQGVLELKNSKKNLDISQKIFEYNTKKLKNGVFSYTDLLNSQVVLQQSSSDYVTKIKNLSDAIIEFKISTGNLILKK